MAAFGRHDPIERADDSFRSKHLTGYFPGRGRKANQQFTGQAVIFPEGEASLLPNIFAVLAAGNINLFDLNIQAFMNKS